MKSFQLAGVIALVLLLLYAGTLVIVNPSIIGFGLEDTAQFGNSYGVFTGLSFLLILWSVYQQNQQLRQQQQEMNRMVSTQVNLLQMELLRHSIDDDDLVKVWGFPEDVNSIEAKQLIYINIIYNQWLTQFRQDLISEKEIRTYLHRSMHMSEHFRKYWSGFSEILENLIDTQDAKARQLHQIAENAYRSAISNTVSQV